MKRSRATLPCRTLPRGALVLAVLLCGAVPPLRAGETGRPGFFGALDAAPLVLTATVVARGADSPPGMLVHELAVQQLLKGTVPAAPQVFVVEDLVFPSDRPSLEPGAVWLVTLEPLPSASRYRALPSDRTYLHVRSRRNGVRSAAATAAVQRYLAAAGGPADTRTPRRLDALIAALPSQAVGGDAVRALAAEPSLARALTDDQMEHLAAALDDAEMAVDDRRALLDLIRAQHLTKLAPAVRAVLADPALAPFARRTLAALGEIPNAEDLRADLERPDRIARGAALESARALPAPERLQLFTDLAGHGGNYEVRAAAIDELARAGTSAVPALAALLRDPDGPIAAKAAQALATADAGEAVAPLSATFDGGTYEAQVAAVFALRSIGSADALRVLREVRAAPPDPRLPKVIDLALGVGHEH